MHVHGMGGTHVSVLWAKTDAIEYLDTQPGVSDEGLDSSSAADRLIGLARPADMCAKDWFLRVSGRTLGELVERRHWVWVATELDQGDWWLYLSALYPGDDTDRPTPWVPDGPTRWWVVTIEEPEIWISHAFDHRPLPSDYPPSR
jgi:hypothetical protein